LPKRLSRLRYIRLYATEKTGRSPLVHDSMHEALAGGGSSHGRRVANDAEHNTPLCNFFLSMLQRMCLEVDAFGASTGALGDIG
jgi:hypothetical protein